MLSSYHPDLCLGWNVLPFGAYSGLLELQSIRTIQTTIMAHLRYEKSRRNHKYPNIILMWRMRKKIQATQTQQQIRVPMPRKTLRTIAWNKTKSIRFFLQIASRSYPTLLCVDPMCLTRELMLVNSLVHSSTRHLFSSFMKLALMFSVKCL